MQDIVDHTIFEAHSEVGGTWLVNDYPGVQCDVPAHIYVSILSMGKKSRIRIHENRPSHSTPTQNGHASTPAELRS